MTKRKILFALSIASVLSLNFITHDRAEKTISNVSHAKYKEFFDSHFPIGFASEKNTPLSQTIIDISSATQYQTHTILHPHKEAPRVEKYTVDATIYKALHPMTDITASGITLDTIHAGKYRIIAVSRDLVDEGFTFGTRVMISGTDSHDGIWVVEDLMNRRWKKRIDFLSDADAPLNRWENITMVKLD